MINALFHPACTSRVQLVVRFGTSVDLSYFVLEVLHPVIHTSTLRLDVYGMYWLLCTEL